MLVVGERGAHGNDNARYACILIRQTFVVECRSLELVLVANVLGSTRVVEPESGVRGDIGVPLT